jgi:hypothetical protein
MVRIDSELNECPDVVKLDLQGGEPEALNGLGVWLPQVKVVKIEVEMLSGDARRRCVRTLTAAGFSMYVQDLQFAVPEMTDGLRRFLHDNGIEIEFERRLLPTDPYMIVKGKWPSRRDLPMHSVELDRDFSNVLAASKAAYFQVDLVALNGRYAQQWGSLLPPGSNYLERDRRGR